MAGSTVTLYDIASQRGICNSPNTWKTRLLLNYKGISYETKFLEYPEVEPTLRSLGIDPFPAGTSYKSYTLPAVTIDGSDVESPVHVMDSLPIAQTLEKLCPQPTLHVLSPASAYAEGKMQELQIASFAAYLPIIPKILNPPSAEYYKRERENMFGTTLDNIYAAKSGTAYAESQAQLQVFKDLLDRDKSGPFVRGAEPSYADFILVGWLLALEQFDKNVFEEFIGFDESFRDVFEACKPWSVRNNH